MQAGLRLELAALDVRHGRLLKDVALRRREARRRTSDSTDNEAERRSQRASSACDHRLMIICAKDPRTCAVARSRRACVSWCRYEAAVQELAAVRQNMERAAAQLIHSRAAF